MKKKNIFIGFGAIALLSLGLIYSCSKSEVIPPNSTTEISEKQTESSTLKTSNGAVVLFSRSSDGTTIYKMQIKYEDNGVVNIERKVMNEGHTGAENIQMIDAGINFAETTDPATGATIVEAIVPEGKSYFYLQFDPGTSAFRMNGGTSGGAIEQATYYCQATCNAGGTCTLKRGGGGGETALLSCDGSCNCELVQTCTSKIGTISVQGGSGSILIEATEVNIVDK